MTIIQDAPTLAPTIGTDHDEAGSPVELLEVRSVDDGEPTFIPPTAMLDQAAGEQAVTAWHNALTVSAMWANASPNNGWASLPGLGWRKVNNAQESSHQSMVALLSLARAVGSKVNVRIEDDNLIHEVYVF